MPATLGGPVASWSRLRPVETDTDELLFRSRDYDVRVRAAVPGADVVSVPESLDEALWIVVLRPGGAPARDWRALQRIKSEIAGPEREAVELFPAESRLVDTANQTHLWVLPAGERVPFGLDVGRVVVGPGERSEWTPQRPLADDWEEEAWPSTPRG